MLRSFALIGLVALAAPVDGAANRSACPAMAGGGRTVAIATGDGLLLVDSKNARPVRLGETADAVAWSADLGRFIVAAGRRLWSVDERGRARRIASLGGRARSLALAPGASPLAAVATDGRREGVSVYRIGATRAVRLGGGVEPWRAPSRVSFGDVDGDGKTEALVLVTARARFDRRERIRPFVYGWDGRRLYPKWLGSRLSRPFDDAVLGDVGAAAGTELLAVEHTREGGREIGVYRWTGFGFERTAAGAPAAEIRGLSVDRNGRVLALADREPRAYRIAGERIEAIATGQGPREGVVAVETAIVAVDGRQIESIHGESFQ